MRHRPYDGLIAPVFTAFKEDGSLNLDPVPEYAGMLKDSGIRGVFLCGSSGEGMLMTPGERMDMTEAWMPWCDEEFRLMVHVGSTSYETSRELAAHAAATGAHAISSIGPCIFQPKTVRDLVRFCMRVASGAPSLPFYYYHIPALSGVNLKMGGFLKEAAPLIPNLAGIKFTSPDLMDMLECLEYGNYEILHGQDQTLLCGMSLGIKGAIGTTYNFMPRLILELIQMYVEGELDKARNCQLKVNRVIALMNEAGGPIPGGKAIMKMIGLELGPCREPLPEISDSRFGKLRKDLGRLNFFTEGDES